ncbi:MAG: SMP-30/gluconolactonase/LRE family protein [Parvularculaceae bacterium]|nr:SMP-30/gluconolactonase/LRE family protein [Parvularculaceae bacterium]
MGRFSLWFSLAALALFAVAAGVYVTLDAFNEFKPLQTGTFKGVCAPVTGVPGPEDVQIEMGRKRVFVSSFDRLTGGAGARGAIYAFNIDDPLDASSWVDRTQGVPKKFEPHGVHLYADGAVTRLFVVNAAAKAIELYDVGADGDLAHLETITERRLTSPNDVVAVGPRAFYVTNDVQPGRGSLLGRLYFLLRAGSGSVLFYDGQSWRAAADGLRYANGVAVSADGERVFVAESAASDLRVFRRDIATNALADAGVIVLDASPDNINIDGDGALWIAAHPRPLSLGGFFAMKEGRSPSLVLRYSAADGGKPVALFADDGKQLSASSAAARSGSTLVIGSLFDRKFLICQLPQ